MFSFFLALQSVQDLYGPDASEQLHAIPR